jgi:ribosomal protein L9
VSIINNTRIFLLTQKNAEDNHPRSCQDTKAQQEEEEEAMKNKIFKAPKIKRKIKK